MHMKPNPTSSKVFDRMMHSSKLYFLRLVSTTIHLERSKNVESKIVFTSRPDKGAN